MIGYACINMELRGQNIFTNRTLRKATLLDKGYDYLCELIIANLEDLKSILQWNEDNNHKFFRISSEIFPFWSHPELGYELEDLPESETILKLLSEIGLFALEYNHRIQLTQVHLMF